MATIRKRGSSYQVQVRVEGHPPQSKSFSTLEDARRWGREIEADLVRGKFIDPTESKQKTLGDCLDTYLEEITALKKGKAQEKSLIRLWKSQTISRKAMVNLRPEDFVELRNQWLKEGYTPATVVRRMALISHLFEIARTDWRMYNLRNLIADVRMPPVRNARSRRVTALESANEDEDGAHPVSDDELQRILKTTESVLLPHLINLAIETAARRSELINLQWEDVNLPRRFMTLRDTKNTEDRDVPLSTRAVEIFKALAPKTAGPVFSMNKDAVTRAFTRARDRARKAYLVECEKAKTVPLPRFLVDLTFHDLRHEATSRLAMKLHMHELARVTGHKDLRMLLRYYNPRVEELLAKLG